MRKVNSLAATADQHMTAYKQEENESVGCLTRTSLCLLLKESEDRQSWRSDQS